VAGSEKSERFLIGLSLFLLLVGLVSGGVMILVRFEPVLDGDSIGPDIIYCFSTFTLMDYLWLFLSVCFFFSGLVAIAMRIVVIVIRLNKGV
jgi:hypothetical protein